ncbi:DOPA 4,5-dioxygenase family protein [Amphritea sp. 1_MG-2023]|uniref:DOPA 4,5-dioxygenase family protein n=1 Tax=Amphritea sp. 1_MG-2023 TaxID=3062670 RepID=UPI0026E3DB83|nr:DOPA 4,5-dioxygenase family protein [Amphritea sp. 1_MG-2023]MDO6562540.1 DOPA 4,5-dioxygenase family protein [Amphritea sp. 1_MG-2023]
MTHITSEILAYHAHVYFDANSLKQAEELCEQARYTLNISMGRIHQKCVGPHSEWSCQLSFSAEQFADVIPWLMLNRHGLTVFIHPVTGNDLNDHTHYTMWLGDSKPLNIALFQ